MKRTILLISALSLFICCGPKQEEVERIMEDGVEVIINHLEPYRIMGEPSDLRLEKVLSIDTERNDVIEHGLTDIRNLDVDSLGNIYLSNPQSKENHIFNFSKDGKFITSFCPKGQGPGEIRYPQSPFQVIDDEVVVSDFTQVLFFNGDGKLLREIPKDISKRSIIPLENGNYLAREQIIDSSDSATQHFGLKLYDSQFNEIKEIIRSTLPNPYKGKGYRAVLPFYVDIISQGKIYVGYSESGYEILIYDLNGNLLKKIRKEYLPVSITEEDKERILKLFEEMPEEVKKLIYFPENFPPFQRRLFTDDEGHLFVMTYEKGQSPREFMYDIFNQDGIYIGRVSLDNYGQIGNQTWPLPALAKNSHLYCIREKESGYKELVVYKMKWE